MEKVSVIMSTYNEKIEWIEMAINSILDQTYRNFKFIIINDNPKNIELKRFLRGLKDTRINLLENDKNLGLVKSLNNALKHVETEYVMRMDADDIAYPNRIEKQLKFMESNKDIALIGSAVEYIDEADNIIYKKGTIIENNEDIIHRLKYGNCINHPTWFFRTQIILSSEIKGYRDIPSAEDFDLLCRLVTNNYKLANINEKLVKYRLRNSGISLSNEFKQEVMKQYVIKLFKKRLNNKQENYSITTINKIINNKKRNIKYNKALELIKNDSKVLNKIHAIFISDVYLKKCISNEKWKITYKYIINKKGSS